MRPSVLAQVARVRVELDHWIRHWQTEIKAETVPRHLECAERLCVELLEKMVRVQGYETQETRGYEAQIELLARTGKEMWSAPAVKRSERTRLSLVPR